MKKMWVLICLLVAISMLSACAQPTAAPAPTQAPAPTTAPVASAPTEAAPTVVPATSAPAAAAPTAAPAAAGPKILKMRLTKDIANLDPANILGSEDDTVDRAVMDGLIRYLPNSDKTENQLAEWIKVSPDGLTIDFKLREGIKWQRGYGELTTDDVKFSFERFADPKLAAAYADDFKALDHVEIVSKYEAKLILKEPQATLWTTTLPMTSGLIMCKKFVEEVGLDKIKTDAVGTGPYVLAEWKPNERITLKRNPDYWGTPPYYDEIQMFPISDDKAAEVALEAGDIDYGIISVASSDRFQTNPDFKVDVIATNSYSWIGLNVENPKLKDLNVREAIRYGIDVPSILEAAYNGKAQQARALIPQGVLGYWADAPLYTRDVAKAKDYMAKAGLKTLDLNLAILNNSEYSTWAQVIQQNLAEVGINITIVPLDDSTFWDLGAGDKGKDVELFTMGFSAQPDPAWFSMWFTCDQVGVWNWMRWCDPKFDALHKQGISTLDTAAREKIYIEMQQLWDASANAVWVTDQPLAWAYKPDVVPALYPGGLCPMLREFKSTKQ
jgi:peptide/nickel transport system substrate-binding protein